MRYETTGEKVSAYFKATAQDSPGTNKKDRSLSVQQLRVRHSNEIFPSKCQAPQRWPITYFIRFRSTLLYSSITGRNTYIHSRTHARTQSAWRRVLIRNPAVPQRKNSAFHDSLRLITVIKKAHHFTLT
jgi:hypothetical protein